MTTMDDPAACWRDCAAVAGTIWTFVALFFVTLMALVGYSVYIAGRRDPAREHETLPPTKSSQVKEEEEAEKNSIGRRLQALESVDLEDVIRLRETGKEMAAISTLSSEYRRASTKRRFLSRKIVCNTVAEVSRRHLDLKITAVFAGSTQEGIGDTLQQIQYLQASNKRKGLDFVESGSACYQYAKRPIFSSDMDVMIVPLAIYVCSNGDLEYEHVQSKPLSFVKLKPTARSKLGVLGECLSDCGYLSARAVKKLLHEALVHAKYVYCGPLVAVAVEEHGVAVEMKWAEPSVDGGFFETVLIADFTFALHIPDWPRCALDWTERARNWPSRHLIAAVAAGGCHAIAFYRDSSDEECQWRLSFSKAELLLFSALPPHAKDMCIALKALFKSRIQPHCPSLGSYHLKTVVLWIVERSPSNLFSSSDGAAVALVKTLVLLWDNVSDGRMPHYFVSGHNIVPLMSQCEKKTAKDVILDTAFYAYHHLTRLRTSEARYFDAKDYILVLLPGERHQPKSAVQVVIQRQLNKVMNAIPDAFEEIPLHVPRKPVLVHLLTGKVVKLSYKELQQEKCLNQYNEIVTAVVQDNVQLVTSGLWGRFIAANFMKTFAHELDDGLVYITEHSLLNARRYSKKVKVHCIVLIWIGIVGIALACGATGGTIATIRYCECRGASNSTKTSQADSSFNSNSYSGGRDNSFNNVYSNDLGSWSYISLVGASRGGTKILSDVSYRWPSYSNGLPYIRG